jgi:murein DD-endopeptidase MepM/ murein hydrolase activator NlpD
MAGAQNFTHASDGPEGMPTVNADALFEDLPKEMLRLFKEVESYVSRISKEWGKTIKETTDAVKDVDGKKTGGGRLGLGSMSRNEKLGMGLGLAAVGAQTYMSMAPNTMAAVTQRIAADSYASMSGMSSRAAILQANRQVGGGATSAMGPTMAAMNIAYQGGYTANSMSSKSIMSQIAGLSAQSGMTNEAAASSVASMNGMTFLRAGIRIRDNNGNLKPIDQIINQVYNFLYRGRQITSEEAQLVYNPGSRSYSTITQLAGGDPNLVQQIQAGIVARTRAKSGKAYSAAMNSKDPNKMLDLMGVDKSSPQRANYRYQSSEARKLAATEKGLVGGYDVALRTTAAVNDGFSTMAGLLGPVNDGLMALKGILQTLPAAGGTGAALSGLASSAMSFGGIALQGKYMSKMFGGGGGGFGGGGGGGPMGFLGKFGKGTGVLGKGSMMGKAGRAGLAAGVYAGSEFLQKWLNKKGKNLPGWAKWLGNFAFDLGEGALTGLAAGGPGGAVAGTFAGGAGNLLGGGVGGPNDFGNLGTAGGGSGGNTSYSLPVPRATPVTSPFGVRDNSMHPGISKNHKGIDYGVPEGSPVYAAADGVVKEVGNGTGWGTFVLLKHADGTTTRYAHLKQPLVSRGDHVVAGQQIAKSGGKPGAPGSGNSTGPHLHFEMTDKNGVRINPAPVLAGKAAPSPSPGADPTLSRKDPSRGLGSGRRVRSQSDISLKNASSPSISSMLERFTDGNPKSWEDILKKVPAKDRQKFLDSIPQAYNGPVTTDKKSLMQTLASHGFSGKSLRTAYAISIAESGGRSNAVGDVKLQDAKWGPSIGLFQIRSLKDWKKYNDPFRDAKRLPDPGYNTQAALKKSHQGSNWKPWSTYTGGAYLKHLAEAETMAAKAGVGGPNETVNLPSNINSSAGMSTQGITITGSRSGHGAVNVTLNMNVTISHGSVQEADRLVRLVGEKLKNDLTLKQIAGSL